MPIVPRVAIACQGGGSHAAFAAGVLSHLLGAPQPRPFEVMALSGTSGGALCAALAWRGLVASGGQEAAQRLLRFWRDLEAHDLVDIYTNFWAVWFARLPVTVEVSPYLYEPVADTTLRNLLKLHLDLEDLTPDVSRRARPKLFIGATDVLKGERVIFTGETLTYDDLIASSAVPPIFRAVPIERPLKQGEAPASPRAPDLYWDGLFTTNPPVREFTDFENPEDRPDEIWVVQINPQERTDEPRTMQEIIDRRNELAGNLSLGQELYFVDSVNKFRRTQGPLKDQYKEIVVRVVQLDAPSAYLDYPSKLDRGVAHIEALLERGRERAAWFFDDRSKWPRDDTVPAKSRYIERKPPETRQ